MFVCLYVCMFVRLCVCGFVNLYFCIFVSLCLCRFVYLCVCMFLCFYVCMCMRVCVGINVCVYVCMCTWAHGRPDVCMDAWVRGCMDVGCMDSKTQPVRKSAPWPPNIFDKDVSSPAPATCNASLPLLFKRSHACHTLWAFYTLWFRNATTACIFSTFGLPKVFRTRSVFNGLTSNCASRYGNVRFLTCHLSDGSAPAALPSLLFEFPGTTKHWKNTVFRDLLFFCAPGSCFFCFFLFSDLYVSLIFFDSSHLCFSICRYCRKFDF